jgi:tetratricopeptide (TPR) repeat protein
VESQSMHPNKDHLLALLARARTERDEWLATFTEAEKEAIGEPHQWTAKDHLAHIAFWLRHTAERMTMIHVGAMPEATDDYFAINDRIFAEWQFQPYQDVLSEADASLDALIAAITTLGEAELTETNYYSWRNGNPLINAIINNGYTHLAEHYAQIIIEQGKSEQGYATYRTAIQTVANFFGNTPITAVARYNYGSFCARNGQQDEALATIRAAIEASPDIRSWVEQDPDLESLRDLAEFKELIG